MNFGNIIKYSASAGSGKTHALTKEYLYRIFDNPMGYRKILAVTFTNKAASEMKHRILDELSKIAAGEETAILSDLRQHFPQYSNDKLKDMSKSILSSILSDYSRFSLSTIDSFFQKVFRSFAKEIGIPTNYGLYVEYSTLLHETVSDMIREMREDDELYKWLSKSVIDSFDEGKPVKLEDSLFELSKLVYSEQYKLLTDDERSKLSDLKNVEALVSELKKIKYPFERKVKEYASEALAILDKHNVTTQDIVGGKTGLVSFLKKQCVGKIDKPSDKVMKAVLQGNYYSSKCNKKNVDAALADGFGSIAQSIVNIYDKDYKMYVSANVVLGKISYVAVLGYVVNSLRERTAYENNYVLADTGDLLRQIIGNDQTPFIYEKTGNDYDVFMIDEFQDTSIIQYYNFKTLLENSISQGFDSLVVGDAKQSIYRWRNGDWSILNEKLPGDFAGRINAYSLDTNWRSLPEIIKFNNTLFSLLPARLDDEYTDGLFSFAKIYEDAKQIIPEGKNGGYVRMEIVDDDDPTDRRVLLKMVHVIEQCQDAGYKASDICLLVKKGEDSTKIMDFLSEYSSVNNIEGRYNFDILSADSLMVGSSKTVRFIVSLMLRILNPKNSLNNGEMLNYFLSLSGVEHLVDYSSLEDVEKSVYPDGYEDMISELGSKSIFEIGEEIVSFFNLGTYGDIAGLNCFQNQVLNYVNLKGSDLEGFTEWWLKDGINESVVLSGEQDAIRIMTIHKSKGLQFKVVVVPFINWPVSRCSNRIWVKTDVYPFNLVGSFPIECSQKLQNSIFAKAYEFERWSSVLDSLNVLYVALTRAEERLYGFLPYKNGGRIDQHIIAAFQYDGNADEHMVRMADYFDTNSNVYEQGTPENKNKRKEDEPSISFDYTVYTDKNRLVFGLNGGSLLKQNDGKKNERAYYGTVLHDILSRIKVADDMHDAISAAIVEGLLPKDRADEVEQMLRQKISESEMSDWFAEDVEVLNEPDILVGKGVVRRPDRVIIKDGKVSVLDYKFGEKRKKHFSQVEEYKDILMNMGYDVEKACVWYVEQNEVVVI